MFAIGQKIKTKLTSDVTDDDDIVIITQFTLKR